MGKNAENKLTNNCAESNLTNNCIDSVDDNVTHAEEDNFARLNLESGSITWAELTRHFARGVLIRVQQGVDLIDVARRFAEDDIALVQRWLDDCHIIRATDDDARDWTAREPEFWCVVVAPWVLVQEKIPATELH